MKRVLNVGWIFSLILGVFAVLAWSPARYPKTSYFLIGLGVLVAIGLAIQLFRKKYDFTIALSMSIAGLSTGATVGFLFSGFIVGKPLHMLLALKWLIASALLNWMYKREVDLLEKKAEPEFFTTNYAFPENFAELNEEQRAGVKQRMEEEIARMDEYIEATKIKNRKRVFLILPLLAVTVVSTIWSAVMR